MRLVLASILLAVAVAATAQAPVERPAESLWLLVTSEPSVVAGDAFELVVAAPAGETLPDEIDVRLKVGVQQRVVTLAAVSPAVGGRRAYRGTMPPGVSGPVAADLPARRSSVLVFLVAAKADQTVLSELTSKYPEGIEPPLSEQDPVYFIVGPNEGWSARFQLSFKYRLFDTNAGFGQDRPWLTGFYFGYTQTSLWDLSEPSRPFRDTSYQPSFFWKWERTDDKTWIDAVRMGVEHESNGGGGDTSRSINIAFVRPEWRWTLPDRSKFEFTPKVYGYLDKSDNPDIQRYRGYVDWRARYDSGDNWITTAVVRVGTAGYGSILVDTSYRIRDLRFGPVGGYLHFQYFNGYGEDILDYDLRRKWQFRVGFAIVP